jgi:hypothetical protein
MNPGFCIIEKFATGPDEPSDFRCLDANSAFTRQTGLRGPIGKTIRELVPDAGESIMERYDQAARSGIPQRFDGYVSALDLLGRDRAHPGRAAWPTRDPLQQHLGAETAGVPTK